MQSTSLICSFNFILTFIAIAHGSIDPSAYIGQFSFIAATAILEANVEISSFSSVGERAIILNSAEVGGFTNIGADVLIGQSATVGRYTNVGPRSKLEKDALVSNYVRLVENVTIGQHAWVNDYAQLMRDVKLDRECIVDSYAYVGYNSIVGERAYVGQYASLGENVIVDTQAVIHQYAHVHSGLVSHKQVIIATPSSRLLFDYALPIHSDYHVNFESSITNLANNQFDELTSQCRSNDESNEISPMSHMRLLITTYLVQYYGVDGYIRILQDLQSNDMRAQNNLNREYHFGKYSKKKILSSDLQQKIVKLLAIDQDIRRRNRVRGDFLCDMIKEISDSTREVEASDFDLPAPESSESHRSQ